MFDPDYHYFNTPDSPTYGVFVGEDLVRAKDGIIKFTKEQYEIVKKMFLGRPDLSANMREIDLDAAYKIVAEHQAKRGRQAESGPSSTNNPISQAILSQRFMQTPEFAAMNDEERQNAMREILSDEAKLKVFNTPEEIEGLKLYQSPEEIASKGGESNKTEGEGDVNSKKSSSNPFGKLVQ